MPAQDENNITEEARENIQTVKLEPLRTFLEWEAPVRPFKLRTREFFSTIGAIVFLVILILAFLKEWFFIGAIIALSFLVYVMSTVAPDKTTHKITNKGVITGGVNYEWAALVRFWIGEKWGQKIVFVETLINFPRRLIMLLGETKEEDVRKILSDYLPEEEPEKTFTDKAGEWISRTIPLETKSN